MHKTLDVAQANVSSSYSSSTSGQASNSTSRLITLAKPAGDQAVVVHLDGPSVLSLANIANENITLVRVGDKLVILFDNKSTITIEPVFDSAGAFSDQNLTFQLGGDRVVTGQEFAGLFPITTDQSILPAAGPAGTPAGANFADHGAIDGLGGGNGPLALLGNT